MYILRTLHSESLSCIPNEILTEIFLLTKSEALRRSALQAGLYQCITDLRLVCHRWNQIILTDSRFWSEIRVSVIGFGGICDAPPLSLVKMWLHRSANALITIDASLDEFTEGNERALGFDYFVDLFSVLEHYLPRCRSLTIRAELITILAVLPTSFSVATELLDFCAVIGGVDDGCKREDVVSLVCLLDTMVSLRHLRLEMSFGFSPSHLDPLISRSTTLRNLTRLELWIHFTLPSILRVLSECQSATHIGLESISSWENTSSGESFPHFRLPCLQSLVVKLFGQPDYRFLEFMDSPNLKLLNLISFMSEKRSLPTQRLTPVYNFLSNPPASLQMFSLSAYELTIKQILDFFLPIRIHDIPVFHIVTRGPFTREVEEDFARRVRKGKKELEIVTIGWIQTAIGWTDKYVYKKWQGALDDLDILLYAQLRRRR